MRVCAHRRLLRPEHECLTGSKYSAGDIPELLLCKLDCAYCNRADRVTLMEIYLHTEAPSVDTHKLARDIRRLRWMFARNVRSSTMVIWGQLMPEDLLFLHNYCNRASAYLAHAHIGANSETTLSALLFLAISGCTLKLLDIVSSALECSSLTCVERLPSDYQRPACSGLSGLASCVSTRAVISGPHEGVCHNQQGRRSDQHVSSCTKSQRN